MTMMGGDYHCICCGCSTRAISRSRTDSYHRMGSIPTAMAYLQLLLKHLPTYRIPPPLYPLPPTPPQYHSTIWLPYRATLRLPRDAPYRRAFCRTEHRLFALPPHFYLACRDASVRTARGRTVRRRALRCRPCHFLQNYATFRTV